MLLKHLYIIPYNHDDPKDEKHLLVLQQTKKFFLALWLFGISLHLLEHSYNIPSDYFRSRQRSQAIHFLLTTFRLKFEIIQCFKSSQIKRIRKHFILQRFCSMSASGLPMLNRAQTFPLSVNKLTPESRNKAWLTADIIPYSKMEQKRVCYPSLEPWHPRDGKRKLDKELETTIKRLKTRDGFLGSNATLREKWSIKFEAANRRMEGTDMSSVPTIMVVAWDENDRDYSAEDEELWIQACKDIVAFLRDHGAAYFGVEIIYWDRLDYQVVT
ncbi:hypothetical protein M434DRAFT_374530 [Hypoxylon sp. CO27-5]|nr:hypothetical protein M434DRAFT_374530 [Hypoxylon sp. CO27-5]